MLKLLEIPLTLPEGAKFSSSMGSVMHGALMEIVGTDVAGELHSKAVRPYSQGVYYDPHRQSPIWRLGTLGEGAYAKIMEPVLRYEGSLYLKQKGYPLSLGHKTIIKEGLYEALADWAFQGTEKFHGAVFSFRTTGSFKQQSGYAVFPEIRLLYQNLLNRWNACSAAYSLQRENLEDILAGAAVLTQYDLNTQSFSLEGRSLYGFHGTMRIRFAGNDMTNRIQALLCSFAPYAGVGIKTALGMGITDAKVF